MVDGVLCNIHPYRIFNPISTAHRRNDCEHWNWYDSFFSGCNWFYLGIYFHNCCCCCCYLYWKLLIKRKNGTIVKCYWLIFETHVLFLSIFFNATHSESVPILFDFLSAPPQSKQTRTKERMVFLLQPILKRATERSRSSNVIGCHCTESNEAQNRPKTKSSRI